MSESGVKWQDARISGTGWNRMTDLNLDERARRNILQHARVIAVVGHSDDPYMASYEIGKYLREAGYRVYPVNPMITEVDGIRSYPSLMDVPEPIDIVDVFRNSEYLPEVVDEALAVGAKTIWTQLGVIDVDGTVLTRALEAGINVVEDMCIRTEHRRMFGHDKAAAAGS